MGISPARRGPSPDLSQARTLRLPPVVGPFNLRRETVGVQFHARRHGNGVRDGDAGLWSQSIARLLERGSVRIPAEPRRTVAMSSVDEIWSAMAASRAVRRLLKDLHQHPEHVRAQPLPGARVRPRGRAEAASAAARPTSSWPAGAQSSSTPRTSLAGLRGSPP